MKKLKNSFMKWTAVAMFNLGCRMELAGKRQQDASRNEIDFTRWRQKIERRALIDEFDKSENPLFTAHQYAAACVFWFAAIGTASIVLLAIARLAWRIL